MTELSDLINNPGGLTTTYRADKAGPNAEEFKVGFKYGGQKVGFARLIIYNYWFRKQIVWGTFKPMDNVDRLADYERHGIGTVAHLLTLYALQDHLGK